MIKSFQGEGLEMATEKCSKISFKGAGTMAELETL